MTITPEQIAEIRVDLQESGRSDFGGPVPVGKWQTRCQLLLQALSEAQERAERAIPNFVNEIGVARMVAFFCAKNVHIDPTDLSYAVGLYHETAAQTLKDRNDG